jgi:hypothetical protein
MLGGFAQEATPFGRLCAPAASFATPSLISATKPRFNPLASDVVHRARKQVKDEASHLSTAGKEIRPEEYFSRYDQTPNEKVYRIPG